MKEKEEEKKSTHNKKRNNQALAKCSQYIAIVSFHKIIFVACFGSETVNHKSIHYNWTQ